MIKDMFQGLSKDKIEIWSVILISIFFIITRLVFPIRLDGSYIDEYWHITSGISLFEFGKYADFYSGEGSYDRGSLMSIWVASWMTLFGKSLFVAKLAPISIGVINYFCVLYLSVKLISENHFRLLLLLLYMVSPWVLFNHFYIRFYIVNELFLLILLVLGYQLYVALKNEKWTSIFLFLFLIISLNLINLLTTNDSSMFMLLIATAVMLAGLFVYEFNVGRKYDQGVLGVILGNICFSNKTYRFGLVLVVAVFGFIVFDAGYKIDFLLNGTIAYTSLDGFKYPWLFLEKNGVITLFFVLATVTFWWKSKGFERVVLPIAGLLFIIHIAASDDLQIIRGILYFLPLYYLAAVIGLSKVFDLLKLKGLSQWLWYVVFSGWFLVSTVTNVNKDFIWGPRIKYEINYIEYETLYNVVTNNCNDKLIVEAAPSSPFIAHFYGVSVDYVLSTVTNVGEYGLFIMDDSTEKYKTVWGSVPVITSLNDIKFLDRDICLVVRRPSMKYYLPLAEQNMLQHAEKSWVFHNLDLYFFERETLVNIGG